MLAINTVKRKLPPSTAVGQDWRPEYKKTKRRVLCVFYVIIQAYQIMVGWMGASAEAPIFSCVGTPTLFSLPP